jgi:hypothetical protein
VIQHVNYLLPANGHAFEPNPTKRHLAPVPIRFVTESSREDQQLSAKPSLSQVRGISVGNFFSATGTSSYPRGRCGRRLSEPERLIAAEEQVARDIPEGSVGHNMDSIRRRRGRFSGASPMSTVIDSVLSTMIDEQLLEPSRDKAVVHAVNLRATPAGRRPSRRVRPSSQPRVPRGK